MFLLKRVMSKETVALDVLRLVLCALLFVHGFHRFEHGDTPALAQILAEIGFPIPYPLAFCVSLAETGGTLLLACRILVLPVCAILAMIYVTGVVLFHWDNGFFVFGAGKGGWEYSALIITCLGVTVWQNRGELFFPFKSVRS